MDYISVKEASGRWNIGERWIQKLCREKRIDGVIRFGNSWMIPKDAVRPLDLRTTKQRKDGPEQKKGENGL